MCVTRWKGIRSPLAPYPVNGGPSSRPLDRSQKAVIDLPTCKTIADRPLVDWCADGGVITREEDGVPMEEEDLGRIGPLECEDR